MLKCTGYTLDRSWISSSTKGIYRGCSPPSSLNRERIEKFPYLYWIFLMILWKIPKLQEMYFLWLKNPIFPNFHPHLTPCPGVWPWPKKFFGKPLSRILLFSWEFTNDLATMVLNRLQNYVAKESGFWIFSNRKTYSMFKNFQKIEKLYYWKCVF